MARTFRHVALPALILALFSGAVAAAPPRSDVAERQRQIREVLASFDLALEGDQISYGPRGRRDLVLFSPRPRDAIVLALKNAYRGARTLPHGYWVGGWAHLLTTGAWTFTLKDPAEGAWVIELADAGLGSRVVIWGLGREYLPERRPRAELPVRLLAP